MSKEIREQTEWEKKLSKLLWEYMEERGKNPEWFLEISTVLMTGSKAMDVYMISKQFWFIEWLIDNDKIDTDKINIFWKFKGMWWKVWLTLYSPCQSLRMNLAIQDEPVKFLSEILKDE